jgi:hypothetical protein
MKREGATEEANQASEAQVKPTRRRKETGRQPISDPCHLDLVQITQASDQSEH